MAVAFGCDQAACFRRVGLRAACRLRADLLADGRFLAGLLLGRLVRAVFAIVGRFRFFRGLRMLPRHFGEPQWQA